MRPGLFAQIDGDCSQFGWTFLATFVVYDQLRRSDSNVVGCRKGNLNGILGSHGYPVVRG